MNKEPDKLPEDPMKETGTESDGNGQTPMTAMRAARECYEWVEIFVVTITVILLVFTFLLRPAYVVGSSMVPTLYPNDALVVSNLFYKPACGDIIVFQAPDSRFEEAIVKRVIATEGQTVDIRFDTWEVWVDGVLLDEPYINYLEGMYMDSFDVTFPLTVPEGCVFAMGDNRNGSTDSRSSDIGFVDTRYIFGRVLFRALPFDRFGLVD